MTVITLTLAVVLFAGCSGWRTVQRKDYAGLANNQAPIKVTLKNSRIFQSNAFEIKVRPDSVLIISPGTLLYAGRRVAIPADSVSRVQVLSADPTSAALIGAGATAMLIWLISRGGLGALDL